MVRRLLVCALLGVLSLVPAAGTSAEGPPWKETRFHTGCDPGPVQGDRFRDPHVLPPPLAEEAPEWMTLAVDLGSEQQRGPILGAGFNLEHGTWSCAAFRPLLRAELLGPFRPSIVRVDTGMLPAAPPNLRADELNRAVYQSVLASEPYGASWRFFRVLNRSDVRIILGIWGGPQQFTDSGDRLSTLLPRYYDDYVEYVVSLIDFMVRQQGIQVWAITVANEPDGGDGNRISVEGLTYIARQLAPRLAPYGVKLYGPDTASAEEAMRYLPPLLDDPVVADALAFVGFHHYRAEPSVRDVVDYVHQRRPDLPVIITEYTSFVFGDLDDGEEARDSVGFMLDVVNTALSHYRNGVDAALYWDAVDYLQPGHVAITRWGLLQGPGDDFERRKWYYGFLQLLPHLQPGSRILDTRQEGGDDVSTLAIRTPDGGTAIVLLNRGVGDATVDLDLHGEGATGVGSLSAWRTDHDLDHSHLGRVRVRDGSAAVYLPGRSITTLVAQGSDFLEEDE